MNIIKLSLSVMGSLFLLTACGEDSGNSNSYTKAKTIEQAEYNLYVLGLMHKGMGIESMPIIGAGINATYLPPQIDEEKTIQCYGGGTLDIAQIEHKDLEYFLVRLEYHKCQGKPTGNRGYQDGTVIYKITVNENGNTLREEFINYTFRSSELENYMNLVITTEDILKGPLIQTVNGVFTDKWNSHDGESSYTRTYTYSNYTQQSDRNRRSTSFNGEVKLDFDCLKGTYKVKTLEKLIYNYEHHIGVGTIMLNGANYIYEDPYMSIEVNGKSKTYLYNEVPVTTPKCK